LEGSLILYFLPIMTTVIRLLILSVLLSLAHGGPVAYAFCQTACNMGAVTCYAAAGLTFGVSGPIGPVAGATACSAAQGVCMALCTPLLIAPTP
jgi:hypothetical protein